MSMAFPNESPEYRTARTALLQHEIALRRHMEAIAAELGISESAAKVRLHRARHKLREQLFPRRDGEASRAV